MPTTTWILCAVILALCGIVGVRGTGTVAKAIVVPTLGIVIGDEDTEGGACGVPFKDTAHNLKGVRLLSCGRDATTGATEGELCGNVVGINRDTR
jgi:hypothetical protein